MALCSGEANSVRRSQRSPQLATQRSRVSMATRGARDGAQPGPNNTGGKTAVPYAVSWAQGRLSHPDTPPNIYEGGLGAQQQQCPSAQGSKPKNFRLRHLRGLALYLPGHVQPAGQCESHWLGRLMARGCLPQPKGVAWPLELPQGILGPASSSSMDPAKGAPSQSCPPEGLGLRPKRSWGASEEPTCPLYKRTRFGALERP
ncbi:hypothetical protein CB1_000398021 [Camelus ferus]|nr:hypothetical protein CB1_000398021 [Camelus ferus]